MNTIIDAHAHCGIIDRSVPQSFEDYRYQIQGSGIETVAMFSPVMEIYDSTGLSLRTMPNGSKGENYQTNIR